MAKRRYGSLVAMILVAGGFSAVAALAVESSPLETVRESNTEILGIFASGGDDGDTHARVYAVMDTVTDFAAMADGAIDRFCADLDAATCTEFKATFTHLLRARAVAKAGRYKAGDFEYGNEGIDGTTAVVSTVAKYKDDSVNLVYHLTLRDGSWMIVNYVVDGVDTVRSHRKQFTRLLRKESVDDVIARLQRKIAEYEGSDATAGQ